MLNSGSNSGSYGSYKYRITEQSYGKLIVFVDRSNQLKTLSTYLIWSCSIGAISLLIVFILVSLLSRRAIKPVIENMEKQKQFITDAGHEIKTPLAIISANADVLELDTGKSEWIDSIR
ncbi:MAG: histidine kinase dimerization/phospho-acceptor domain-containing protein, partial [Pseudoruminococcus massiliensis]